MKSIPDLRSESIGISFEHCSVLLERLRDTIDLSEGVEGFGTIVDELDPTEMRDLFEQHFLPDEFSRLFSTDLGKGVLVGIYIHSLLASFQGDLDDSETY